MLAEQDAAKLILELIDRINATIPRLAERELSDDADAQDAIAFRLLHIGEHVRSLGLQARASRPDIAWQQAVAMRHRLAHDHIGVDPRILWNTAIVSPPPLAELCRAIVARYGADE